MKGQVANDVKLRRMESGRNVFAMEEGKTRLEEATTISDDRKAELENFFQQAIDQGRKTLKTEHSYAQTRDDRSKARGKAVEIDNELDTLITDMRDIAEIRSRSKNAATKKAATNILTVNYPGGSAAITHLNFEEQLGVMQTMVGEFRGDLADDVVRIGLGSDVERFEGLIGEFRTELATSKVPVTTWDMVTADRQALHEAVAMAKVQVLAAFSDLKNEAMIRERESILEPLREQEARVLEMRRRQRQSVDVNPDTGEELPVSDDDILGPASEPNIDEDAELETN